MGKTTSQPSENKIGTCSNCGGAVDAYTISRKGMWWDTGKENPLRLGARGLTLPSTVSLEGVPAWKCKKCKLIMFQYRSSLALLKKCTHCHAEIPLSAGKCEVCGTQQRNR